MRKAILHYHLFKNAGTSVDAVLKDNFPGSWIASEFQGRRNSAEVGRWIEEHVDATAFSSHTAQFPLPDIETFVLPIVFLRHPIDRIMSVYLFERTQNADTVGSKLARSATLAQYVDTRLRMGADRQCRNFHVDRLAQFFPPSFGQELHRAIKAVESIPYFGIVEQFDVSLALLETYLCPHFPDFKASYKRLNASRSTRDLDMRLGEMRCEIGETAYKQLEAVNEQDLELYDFAVKRFASR